MFKKYSCEQKQRIFSLAVIFFLVSVIISFELWFLFKPFFSFEKASITEISEILLTNLSILIIVAAALYLITWIFKQVFNIVDRRLNYIWNCIKPVSQKSNLILFFILWGISFIALELFALYFGKGFDQVWVVLSFLILSLIFSLLMIIFIKALARGWFILGQVMSGFKIASLISLVLALSLFVIFLFLEHFQDFLTKNSNIIVTVSFAIIIVTIGNTLIVILKIIKICLDFVKKGWREINEELPLKVFESIIMLSVLVVLISLSLVSNQVGREQHTEQQTEIMNRLNGSVAAFILPFPNGSLDNKDILAESGYEVSSTNRETLEKIIEALVPCAQEPSEKVKLVIEGYASSAEFGDKKAEVSNDLNARLAFYRASSVHQTIVEIIAKKFKNNVYFDIAKSSTEKHNSSWIVPQFIDGIEQIKESDKTNYPEQFFTRSVFVRIIDAGQCDRWLRSERNR